MMKQCRISKEYRRLREDELMVKNIKNGVKRFWEDESGMGVVEIVLIIIVLIGLVVLFKKQITSLVNSVLVKMTSQANQI